MSQTSVIYSTYKKYSVELLQVSILIPHGFKSSIHVCYLLKIIFCRVTSLKE